MLLSSQIIKQIATNCGFALCGIAKAEPLVKEKERFEKALSQNFHAKKEYLERDIEKRFNPSLLLTHCKSVIVCGFNYNMEEKGEGCRSITYYNSQTPCTQQEIKVSKYAQIKDYHVFMKEKLEKLAHDLQDIFGVFNSKTTIDSSTISEKAWAVKAGIGYYGKNGLIQTAYGSYVFLGTLLIDREIDIYDNPNRNSCSFCNKCIRGCPTQAIVSPFLVDSNLCISNINLNRKDTDFKRIAKYGWLVGCDACQILCPNNFKAPVNREAVAMRVSVFDNNNKIPETLSPESFEKYFKDTVIYPFKYEELKKRIEFITPSHISNLFFIFQIFVVIALA